jgi:hypothetical protein
MGLVVVRVGKVVKVGGVERGMVGEGVRGQGMVGMAEVGGEVAL